MHQSGRFKGLTVRPQRYEDLSMLVVYTRSPGRELGECVSNF